MKASKCRTQKVKFFVCIEIEFVMFKTMILEAFILFDKISHVLR